MSDADETPSMALIADEVPLSPPGTETDDEARREEARADESLDYNDWWFTTKQR